MIEKLLTVYKHSTARQSLAVLCSGLLLGIGFVFSGFPLYPLAFVGAALFIIISTKAPSQKSAFFKGWAIGLIFYVLVFANITIGSFPIDWIGIENVVLQLFTIAVVWFLVSLAMAIGYGILGWLIFIFKTSSWMNILTIPLLWVVCEMLSVWFFSLITFGPGTLFGGHFTLGFVGYLFANNLAVLQLASLGGVYLLSFTLVAIGTLIATWWTRTPKDKKWGRYGVVLLSSIFFLIISGIIYSNLPSSHIIEKTSDTVNVAAISRYADISFDDDPIYWDERYIELRELITPLRDIDVLVFPEISAFLMTANYKKDNLSTTLKEINNEGVLLVDSANIIAADATLRSVATYYIDNKVVTSEKQFLVPFGEYLPYLYVLPMRIFGQSEMVEEIISTRGYKPGINNKDPEINGATVAVRFCDELLSPSLYQKQVKNGATVLVNMSSFSWFHGSNLIYKQIQNIAKVRAVENGRWYAQSGNMAPAFILDNHGRVVIESEPNLPSVVQATVPNLKKQTLYNLLSK